MSLFLVDLLVSSPMRLIISLFYYVLISSPLYCLFSLLLLPVVGAEVPPVGTASGYAPPTRWILPLYGPAMPCQAGGHPVQTTDAKPLLGRILVSQAVSLAVLASAAMQYCHWAPHRAPH